MERGEGYQPDIELVDKQPKSAESATKYESGDKVGFKERLEGRETGRIVDGVVVGVDSDSLRVMEPGPNREVGPVRQVLIGDVIAKKESNGESGQKAA